ANGPRPPRIAGVEIKAPAGGQLFVDDLAVVPGIAAAGDERWATAKRAELPGAFAEDFEATPYGLLVADADWRSVDGPVSALVSPAGAAATAPAPSDAGNAFAGGTGF